MGSRQNVKLFLREPLNAEIPMKHPLVIAAALCVHLWATPCAGSNQASLQNRPNLILIVADDMGWGDVRSHGNDRLDTPVLDRLAADGARSTGSSSVLSALPPGQVC
jgi:hypothetical protein